MIQLVRITTVPANYATSPDASIPWQPSRVTAVNEDGTFANGVFLSSDGINNAAIVMGGQTLYLIQKNQTWWVKKVGGAASGISLIFEK